MKTKRIIALLLAAVMAVTAFGCKKKEEGGSSAAPVQSSVAGHENEARSYLTGQWVS